ncbi:NAD(P)-dependent oxidoreductase [Tistrella bauzanensis]|uniref:NAD(P)-dependent oxidoreductase n=1 Tax=Tistrella bauzanensis TaxID=657419 RepID=A0ABQ1IIV1_9PROT|nr:SDR family NAD(P)-dependent oxidoreductase [Tistrella bauzanensis]GGB38424.1 NAD(P)-dependent oxidoreductase [Tistrella bauzanensis]
MTDRLTVLITGATAGFGAALARAYAASGDRLVLIGRRTERLEALKAELGGEVHVVTLDVRDRAAVETAIAALPAPFDAVDVLINNAGLARGLNPAQSADLDDWDTMIDTNIKGVTYMARAVLLGMVARDRGHIINLGSVAGTYPYPGGNVYGGTKAFVHQFSLNLRADLLGSNVRVTCIEPGMAETEFSLVRFSGDDSRASKVYEGMTPMSADDIAGVIHWVTKMPRHVNVNTLELMPVMQAFNNFAIKRG